MRHLVRSAAAATVACLALTGTVLAQGGDRCTHDLLTVDGAALTATFCVTPSADRHVVVAETFTRGAQSFSRSLALDAVEGATVTRAVDDIPLTEFGSPKQLHVTVAYRNGIATLEHALLLPGAVVLK
jgi:hypothetical protein